MVRNIIGIALILLVGYAVVEAWPLLSGPSITLSSPQHAESYPGGLVTVSGTAHRVSDLSLNGAPLLIDETGAFSRLIILPKGGAILTLVATDRFGRSITKQASVYVP